MDAEPKRLTDLNVLVEELRPSLNAAILCFSRSWGGLEQVAASDALAMGSLGLRVRVVCLEGTPIHQQLSGRPEVRVEPLAYRPRNYLDLKLRADLDRLIANGVNLIHTHQTSFLGSVIPWLWNKRNVAMLASRHIMNNHDKRNFIHAALYSRVDALIAMSQSLRRNILETHPVRERQVKVVNLGLDFERFNAERPHQMDPLARRTSWGADPDTVVMGLVGRIDPAKGQATFLRAAAGLLVNSRAGEKLKFVIVGEQTRGSHSTHLAELKAMVAQFRIEDHVLFTGFEENIPEVMGAMDIFVMPSRQEAFGLVAIEAMAMGCPVVISTGGSAEEIVGKQQEYGLLVRPDDAFDLQKQLRYLLDHPEERRKMGLLGRDYVRANYDKRRRIQQTLELYERALRRRKAL